MEHGGLEYTFSRVDDFLSRSGTLAWIWAEFELKISEPPQIRMLKATESS